MLEKNKTYKAIVSSDWNECLAPCGPFDFISFNFPRFANPLETIFKQYTGNRIALGDAVLRIQQMLPAAITEEQMDLYLDESFATYRGVPELIEWCLSSNILFMINTTGMIGYFQRIFANHLLPKVPVLSAHPLIRYPRGDEDPQHIYDLFETSDKGKNTETVIRSFNIPSNKIILMGDSGGDGPHFKWGEDCGAFLIGCMIKTSLQTYCEQQNIRISARFGGSNANAANKNVEKDMQINFMDLAPVIEDFIDK